MSRKLNENQLIAVHLIASGFKASNVSKKLGIREETLSRWRQEDIFKEALEDTTEIILKEIVETHKNILIKCQSIIVDTLNDKNLEMIKREPYIDLVIGPQAYHKINDAILNHTKKKRIEETDFDAISSAFHEIS